MSATSVREQYRQAALDAVSQWDGHDVADLILHLVTTSDEDAREVISDVRRRLPDQRYRRPVRCLDTGQVFGSVAEAAEYAGATPAGLVVGIKQYGGRCRGKRFEYAEERP